MRHSIIIMTLILFVGCTKTSGFSEHDAVLLPPGDIAAGAQAYRDLRCHACHQIYGSDMPAPTADPVVPVYLGGNAIPSPSRRALVRAIVDPSHELAPGWGTDLTVSGRRSRMGDYTNAMTVRQLVDVVAFVQSRYGPDAERNVRLAASR